MKRIKLGVLVIGLIVMAAFSISVASNSELEETRYEAARQELIEKDVNQLSFFEAEITFYILTGEGCGCTPIVGASITAAGGEGNASGVTDEEGKCILTLVILGEYEVWIEAEGYRTINFEFNIIDDQTFTFHLDEKDGGSVNLNGNTIFERFPNAFPILRNLLGL